MTGLLAIAPERQSRHWKSAYASAPENIPDCSDVDGWARLTRRLLGDLEAKDRAPWC